MKYMIKWGGLYLADGYPDWTTSQKRAIKYRDKSEAVLVCARWSKKYPKDSPRRVVPLKSKRKW